AAATTEFTAFDDSEVTDGMSRTINLATTTEFDNETGEKKGDVDAPYRGTRQGLLDLRAAATTEFTAFDDNAGVSLAIGSISTDGSAVVAVGSRAAGSRVRLFNTEGTLLREFADVLEGEFPNGVNVTAQDINGDNFADLIVSGRAGGPPLITALDGEDIATGEAEPARLFTFTAGGGETAGAQVALAYNDMPTKGTYMPKIITTPEQGPLAGTVQVWDTTDFVAYHSHTFDGSDMDGHMGGHMGHGGSSMMDSETDSMMSGMGDSEAAASPLVEFQPFNGEGGAVELTTSYLQQDGGAPVLPVIINWQTDTEIAYTSIDAEGEASTTVLHYREDGTTTPASPRSPISFQLSQLTGPVTAAMAGERFIIQSAFGGTVEKWDGIRWRDVMAAPQSSSPTELLRQLNFRLIGADDLVRWTPPASEEGAASTFRILGWDGANLSDGHEVAFQVGEVVSESSGLPNHAG
ncbi:MAG: hypothetical protein EBS83_13420, partial [Planctomycetia bacterium]|nr:hypothetical protein [Planctomycetia bacterium]